MERLGHWFAWITVALIVVFAGLNWGVLSAPASLNLVLLQIEAPLGVVLLGMTGVFVALFFLVTLYSRVGALVESRRMLKEVQQARDLAERAEASRLENLHQLLTTEFRLINQRLDALGSTRAGPLAEPVLGEEPAAKPAGFVAMLTGRSRA